MRRKDREITDEKIIHKIIMDCDCCRLGFQDNDSVYIVPLNFGFTESNGQIILYFHSAREGRKIDLIQNRPHVGFEMDTHHQLNTGELACEHSFRYQSIIGQGDVSLVNDEGERLYALQLIMSHYTAQHDWDFSPKMVQAVAIFKMKITELTCKEHK